MSKLNKLGPWYLRFLTIDKETGVLSYLTSNGVGKVVTVESKTEPPKQTWFAVPVDGKKDYYTIIQDLGSMCPQGLAQDRDSNKVILSEEPCEWYLEYVPIDIDTGNNGDVYKIHPPPTKIIGVDCLLGREGNDAVIQTFPIVPENSEPAWQFLVKLKPE